MKKQYLRILPPLILLLTIFVVVIIFLTVKRSRKENQVVTLVNSSLKYVAQLSGLENAVQFHIEAIANYAHGLDKDNSTEADSSAALVLQRLDFMRIVFKNDTLLQRDTDSLTEYIIKRIELSGQIISLGKEKGIEEAASFFINAPGYKYSNRIFGSIRQLQLKVMQQLEKNEVINTQAIKNLGIILTIFRFLTLILAFIIVRSFLLDFSVSKRMEKQLKNYNEELQKNVAKKTDEIRQSEERYRILVEQASDAIIINDVKGNLLDVNDIACNMLGYSKEELCTKNAKELVEYENDQEFKNVFERLARGESTTSERKIKRQDGSLITIETHAKMLSDGRIMSIVRDITERKRVEEALRASEFNNRMVVENKIVGIAWASAEGKVINANQVFCDMMGYSLNELKGLHFSDFTHPDDVHRELELVDKMEKGTINSYVIEKRYRRKNGDYTWVELNLTGYRNLETGTIEFFIGLVHDIQEQKQFEEALKASEKKLRQVLSSYGDVFYVIDKNYRIILINEIAEKKLAIAWNKPVYLGANLLELIPSQSEEPIQHSFEKVFRGETIEYELHVPTKGLPPWVSVTYFPVKDYDGSIIGAYVITKDISERKKVEEDLRQSINRFELISRTTNDAIWEWKLDTGRLWGNEPHQQLYGLTVNDPVPTSEMWIARMHPDDRDRIAKKQEEALASNTNIFISEYRFNVEGKGYCDIYDRCYIVRDETGKAIRMMGSMMDITERKKMEQELREAESKFRNLVEQSLVGVYILQDGKYAYVNPTFAEIFGYDRNELINDFTIQDLIHPGYRSLVSENIRSRMEGKQKSVHYEAEGIRKNGEIVQVEIFGSRTEYRGRPAIIGTALNISHRKRAEAEIRKAKALSDQIIDSLPGIFYLFNDSAVFLRWNKQFEIVSGYNTSEVANMRPWEFFEGEEIEYIRNKIQSVFVNGLDDAEARFVSKDKKRTPFYFKAVRINYENQNCLLGYGIDISDRKKAEEELEESYIAIRLLTEHLQNIREEERMHIAREIHDELGQQLTVLKMDASWLNKKLTDADENVKQKLGGLLELMDSTVKTVRRISSELRPSLLDDMGLVPAMEWHLKEFEKRTSLKTQLKAPSEELDLPDAVKTGLFRILQESLTNVARHANAKKVDVNLQIENGTIVMSIKDNGKGFEMEKAKAKKTLGILGMRERSFMMGGNYEVKSKPGKGTNVIVSVPYPGNK